MNPLPDRVLFEEELGRTPRQIRGIGRQIGPVARHRDRGVRFSFEFNGKRIANRDRNHQGLQIVEPVGSFSDNFQIEVDLCRSKDFNFC